MSITILFGDEQFPIRPEDFNAENEFPSSFGKLETEQAAQTIVFLCQQRGSWGPFSFEQAQKKHTELGNKGKFDFCGLVESWTDSDSPPVSGGWIWRKGSKYYITDEFIFKLAISILKQHLNN